MSLHYELILCSLLTDIERFTNKSIVEFISNNKAVFEQYCDMNSLLMMANMLNESSKESANIDVMSKAINCIKEAREISLTQTDKRAGKVVSDECNNKNLTSVFFRVKLSDDNQIEKHKYDLGKLLPQSCFPKKSLDNDVKREGLVEQFEEELLQFVDNSPLDFMEFLIPFEALLKKYLWCITASDYEGEDISLYDHARITSAIANSLYIVRNISSDITEEYKLVAGNFSGIQRYIFSMSSTNQGNVAKGLRSRSFFVDATVGVFAQYIIDKFHLPRFHILMLTGGKFYILLPNTEDADKTIQLIEKEIEDEIYHKFKGQLSTNLAYINVNRIGLEEYDKTITELSKRLNVKKKQPFQTVLIGEDGWNENMFVLEENLLNKTSCPVCRAIIDKEKVDPEDRKCAICKQQEELGKRLPNSNYIAYYKNIDDKKNYERQEVFSIFKGYSIQLYKEDSNIDFRDAYLIEKIEDSNIEKEYFKYPITFEYRANFIPTNENNEAISFDQLAKESTGKQYIAVLKADVDNLGYIFSVGLKLENKHYGTISRVNTMSRLFTVFFSGVVQELLHREDGKYSKVYSVFAGGDDLFLIGPWSMMPELAEEINNKFREFTCHNKDITLSATIDLYNPKTHIATMAEISEKNLEQVKIKVQNYFKTYGRDGIHFFGQVLGWKEFEHQLMNGNIFSCLIEEGTTSMDTTFMRRVNECSIMYQEYLDKQDLRNIMYKPKLHYVIERKKWLKDEKYWVKDYIKRLDEESETRNKELYYASSTMKYIINRTRKGEKDE